MKKNNKQENPFAKLLKETVYNHDSAEFCIEMNDLDECCADLRNWCKELKIKSDMAIDTVERIRQMITSIN